MAREGGRVKLGHHGVTASASQAGMPLGDKVQHEQSIDNMMDKENRHSMLEACA